MAQAVEPPLRLTNAAVDGYADWPVYNPNGGKVLFHTTWPSANQIFSVNNDGTGKTQLSESGWQPEYSFDGTSIVFHMLSGEWPNSSDDIFKMNSDGTGLVNLTSSPLVNESDPSFSHDGTKIVYRTEDWSSGGALFIMDSDGSNKQNITNHPGHYGYIPIFSPDDSKILYTRAEPGSQMHDMWVIDVNTKAKTNLTNTPSENEQPTKVSPDGTKVAYAIGDWGGPNHSIYTINIDGSNKQLISSGDGYVCCVYFSADGSKVSYSLQNSAPQTYKIVESDVDGQNQVVLVAGEGQISCCIAWSPDAGNLVVALNGELWRYGATGGPPPPSPDGVPPVTSLEISPPTPNGQNGWYVTVPQLKLGASEEASISHSYVSPSGPWTVDSFFDVFTDIDPPAEGLSTLYYFSKDAAGNTEPVQSSPPIAVDTGNPTAPTLTLAQTGDQQINLSWTPSDDSVSGFDHYEVFANGEIIANTAATNHEVFDLLPGIAYPFFIKAVDRAGNVADSNTVMIELRELNQAPVVNAGGPYAGNEGEAVNFDASGSSDPDGDPLLYRWDFASDGTWDTEYSSSPLAQNAWNDNYNGVATVEVTDGKLTVSATTLVTVNNVAPVADAGQDKEALWGEGVSFRGSFADPGTNDAPSAVWDFGDQNSANGLDAVNIYRSPGIYTANLSVTDKDSGVGADEAFVTVNKRTSSLTYDGDASGRYSDLALLSATLLTDAGGPIANAPVTFTVGGREVGAVSDILGKANATVTILEPAGAENVVVSWAGNDYYQASETNSVFEVAKDDTSLDYLGDAIGRRGTEINLVARLFELDSQVGDLSGKTINFTITDGLSTQVASAVTNVDGRAQTSAQITNPAGVYSVNASFAGDEYYNSSADESPFVIWEPIAGLKVTGGGWLTQNGSKINFGFNAQYKNDSAIPEGGLQVIDRNFGQNIQSEGFGWFVVTAANMAIVEGSVKIDGQSGHAFRLIVSDISTAGKGGDLFELQVDGLTRASGVLEGGNIVVH